MTDSAAASTFGSRLRRHRLLAGLTQATLGERAGIAERTIQDLERGASLPRRQTVRRLVDALALLPEARTELEAAMPAARQVSTPTRTSGRGSVSDRRRHNLPIQPTALLGREREVAEIRTLFQAGARLVTLTGPGGVGKTRVSVQVAAELLGDHADGVFLVELAPIMDPALLPSSIAQVLGVRDLGGQTLLENLKAYLRRGSLLLLLDNFEQIVTAAPVVAELLASSPGLRVLVTSREPLRLRGEHEYDVPPLALPDAHQRRSRDVLTEYAAVALFVERAMAIQADFVMTEESAPAIAEICARLDGLPLAIELAAARVRLLTPQMMADRLERRLQLVTGGARDLPDRQQTLRNTIAWSHDLLDEFERCLFRRLSAFVGGWSVEAAEAVCDLGDPGDLDYGLMNVLESLISRNLIRRGEDLDGEPRFSMLETIREYGLEQLEASGEVEQVWRHHVRYFLAMAECAEPKLRGAEQGAWLNRLEAEHDNLRAALQFSVEKDEAEIGLRLGGALSHFWEVRGYRTEGRARLSGVLHLTGTAAHPWLRAKVLCEIGFLTSDRGDQAAARVLSEESLAIMRGLGDRRGVATSLDGLAWIANDLGDFSTGRALHEESLAIMREVGDRRGIALALSGLGYIASVKGDHAAARLLSEESLAIMRELGDRREVARTLAHLGAVTIDLRNHTGARALLMESLAMARELGDPRVVIDGLETAAYLAVASGRTDRAARLQGAAETLRETIGVPLSPSERALYELTRLAALRAALSERVFAAAWAEGRAMSMEQAVAYALHQDSEVSAMSSTVDDVSETTSNSSLTPREAEVVALVARGLTNRQIAAELVISERTASSHLYRIFGKLGFTSRARLAAWAVERGLVRPERRDEARCVAQMQSYD